MHRDHRRGRRPPATLWAAVLAGLLLVGACGAAPPPRFSGPLVPHGAVPEGFEGPSRGPGRFRRPSDERPPWRPDPPADPDRRHVPDDGFRDALALA